MPDTLSVLIAVKDESRRLALRKMLQGAGYKTTLAAGSTDCKTLGRRRIFHSVFLDRAIFRELPRHLPFSSPAYVVLVGTRREKKSLVGAVAKERAHDLLWDPFDDTDLGLVLTRAQAFLGTERELLALRSREEDRLHPDIDILFQGRTGRQLRKSISHLAHAPGPVLICAPPGSEPELWAQSIHNLSKRAHSPFLVLDVQARDHACLERELFGEIPARNDRNGSEFLRGHLSRAGSGTLVLLHANRMARRPQQKLARTLSAKRFSPMGGGENIGLEAKVILTCDEKHRGSSHQSVFPRELARLLKTSQIKIPSLHDRKDDLPTMAEQFISQQSRFLGTPSPVLTADGLDRIRTYDWPGNVREFRSALSAAALLARDGRITNDALELFLSSSRPRTKTDPGALESVIRERLGHLLARFGVEHLADLHRVVISQAEKPLIELVLKATKGNQLRAAQILGVSRNTLRRKITQYNGT